MSLMSEPTARTIDDRRRFRSLSAELVYARAAAAVLVSPLLIASVEFLEHPCFLRPRIIARLCAIAIIAVCMVAPTVVARRGPRTPLVILGGGLVGLPAVGFLMSAAGVQAVYIPPALAITLGAIIGCAEGMAERSIATTYGGLLGGAAGMYLGLTLGAAASCLLSLSVRTPWLGQQLELGVVRGCIDEPFLVASPTVVVTHLVLGLSLALGRRIRDLPKRAHPEPPPA